MKEVVVPLVEGVACRVTFSGDQGCLQSTPDLPPEWSTLSLRLRQGLEDNGEGEPFDPDSAVGRYKLGSDGYDVDCVMPSLDLGPTSMALRLCCLIAFWNRGGLLLHAAGLARDPAGAILALAPSGGGKSTLTSLAQGFWSLSDETVAVDLCKAPIAFGTRFRSSSPVVPQLRSAPVRAILILEKSLEPSFEPVSPASAARMILSQTYRPVSGDERRAQLLLRAKLLAEAVPAFRFRFPKSSAANDLLHRLFDEHLAR